MSSKRTIWVNNGTGTPVAVTFESEIDDALTLTRVLRDKGYVEVPKGAAQSDTQVDTDRTWYFLREHVIAVG